MPQGGVQSVSRAFALLECLVSFGGEAGLAELATTLGAPPSSVHRTLRSLLMHGYVTQLPSRRYSLGPALIPIGEAATRRLSSWAMPALTRLGELTQETANMAVLDGDMAAYVAQVPSRHQMRMFTEVGRRVYPHSTGVGKALLAQLPDERVVEIVQRTGMPAFTSATLLTATALLADLEVVRLRGYATDDGEQEVGVRCIAVPVTGIAQPAAVSVSGPAVRMAAGQIEAALAALRDAANRLRTAASNRS